MTRTKAERAAIDRDGPACLRCNRDLTDFPASVHHRLPRSGGTKAQVDVVSNLVVVCGSGTSPHCHQWIHSHPYESMATGWTVRRNGLSDPADLPLYDLAGRQLYLTEEATVVYTSPAGFFPTSPTDHITPF